MSLPSFGCRVSQGGAKTFILKLHNSRRAIGRYPIVTLSAARTEAKRLLAEKTLGKVRPQSITYEQATKLFLEEKGERRRARTVADHKRHLSLLGFKCQLADVTHADLERKLKKLPPSEFNHRLACAKTFFRWAQCKRYRDDDPTVGLSPHTRPSRSRVLSDTELQLIWRACEQTGECSGLGAARTRAIQDSPAPPHLPANFATIVKLLILTGQRRGEIAALRTDYLSNDLCTLPPSLTKNKREHTFPLSELAQKLLSAYLSSGTSPTMLFPARGKTSQFNGWSKSKAALDKLSGVSDWTLHDIRRTFATRLAELGVAPHIIERLLNHISGTVSGVAAIYNRAQYLAEMRTAIELWEAYLQKNVCCTA